MKFEIPQFLKLKLKVIALIILSYSTYYIVRTNLSFCIPFIMKEYDLSKVEVGTVFSVFSIIYGIGKFFSGVASDLLGAKKLIITGLMGSAIISLFLTNATSMWDLILLWGVNALFQSMGWPPCVKILNNWFKSSEMGFVWGVCNSAHAIGSSAIALSSGFIVYAFGWRGLFYVPALISLLISFILLLSIQEFPEKQDKSTKKNHEPFCKVTFFKEIFKNPIVWSMSLGIMFLYVVRIGFLNWLPTFLLESAHSESSVGLTFSGFEGLGIGGGIVAGYLSDRVGVSHRSKIGMAFVFSLILCIVCLLMTSSSSLIGGAALVLSGFFIYGPQVLSGIIANDYASKRTAASATGLLGAFSYIGSTLAGAGLGLIIEMFGWNAFFVVFFVCAFCCFLCFTISNRIGLRSH